MGQDFYNLTIGSMVFAAFFGMKWAVVLGMALIGSVILYEKYIGV